MLRLSIIIPYYNRENTICRCLQSINISKHEDVEIIVIDDNSTVPLNINDESLTVIKLDTNMGPVAARSFGVDIAKGDFVLFLDSDDELVENWYDLLFNTISLHKNFDLYAFPDISSKLIEHSILSSLEEYWIWSAVKNRPSDFILCIKRSVFSSLQVPKYRIGELWFIYSIYKNNFRGLYTSNPLFVYHQDSGNQLSKLRRFKFLLSDYERKSIVYSLNAFLYNERYLKSLNPIIYKSWQRRLIKESFLSFNLLSFVKLIYGKLYDAIH